VVKGAVFGGGGVVVSFSSAAGLKTSDGRALRGFELVDEGGDLLPARATIRGRQVFLTVPQKAEVTRVVYGWKPFTRANLVNKAGLPASTFMIPVNQTELRRVQIHKP
jgi:sialate O-acetylesterase